MSKYDFSILKVVDESSNSKSGLYWEEVVVDNMYYGKHKDRNKFQTTGGTSQERTVKIMYLKEGVIDEKNTFNSDYLKYLKEQDSENEEKEDKKNETDSDKNGKKKSSEATSCCSSDTGLCCLEKELKYQILFTLCLILPIVWFIKLCCSGIVYCIKAICYIITWPIRLLLCCCCPTSFLPEKEDTKMPEYWFNCK